MCSEDYGTWYVCVCVCVCVQASHLLLKPLPNEVYILTDSLLWLLPYNGFVVKIAISHTNRTTTVTLALVNKRLHTPFFDMHTPSLYLCEADHEL